MLKRANWCTPKQSGSCLKLLRATSDWLIPHKSVQGAQSQGQADRRLRTSAAPNQQQPARSTQQSSRARIEASASVKTSAIVPLFARIRTKYPLIARVLRVR